MRTNRWLTSLVLLFTGHHCQATVLDFDDITGYAPSVTCSFQSIPGATCITVPSFNQGLAMGGDNGWIMNGCAYAPTSGYCAGTQSAPNVWVGRPPDDHFQGLHLNPAQTPISFYGTHIALSRGSGTVKFSGKQILSGTEFANTVTVDSRGLTVNFNYLNLRLLDITTVNTTEGGSIVLDNTHINSSLCMNLNESFGLSSQIALGNQVYTTGLNSFGCGGEITATSIDLSQYGRSKEDKWEAGCTLSGNFVPVLPYDTPQAPRSMAPCNAVPDASVPVRPLDWSQRFLVTVDPVSRAVSPLFNETFTGSHYTSPGNPQYGSFEWLKYIAGNRQKEGQFITPGTFRPRRSVLGDIVNPNPTPVGPPNAYYDQMSSDLLANTSLRTEATAYAQFKTRYAHRMNIVYIGSNDGFLHGFRAGSMDSNGNVIDTIAAPNDGQEMLAYSPSNALATLYSPNPELSFADHQYEHQFYVDGTAGYGDAYVNGKWQTWLVGGLGSGGTAAGTPRTDSDSAAGLLYAINITDPGKFNYSALGSSQLDIQEVNSGAAGVPGASNALTIRCNTSSTPCSTHLGGVSGAPVIQRMHNGRWDAIVGNGQHSLSGHGGIFILNDLSNLYAGDNIYLDAPATINPGQKNGIVEVTPVDLDGDGVVDYIYAGDVLGNVWRFDVTSTNSSDWANTPPVKVFPAANFNAPNLQPITTKVQVTTVNTPSGRNVLVEFGTGRIYPLYASIGTMSFATGAHAIYGIWDWKMSSWNTKSATQYHALNALPTNSSLLLRPLVTRASELRSSVSGIPVCWIDTAQVTGCSNHNNYGWEIDLSATSNGSYESAGRARYHEQVVSNPLLLNGIFLVNTVNALNAQQGSAANGYTIYIANDGQGQLQFIGEGGTYYANSSALGRQGLGSPLVLTYGNSDNYLFSRVNGGNGSPSTGMLIRPGNPSTDTLNFHPAPPAKKTVKRITWIQLR